MQALIVAATPKHRAESKTTHALLRIVSAEIKRFVAEGILRGTLSEWPVAVPRNR